MQPLISIIVPVYNGENFIGNCIDSILEQTIPELQIIVVDDGSTDSTLKILKGFAEKDSRIEVIHQSNGGVSNARNTGLAAVKAEWVVFIDADDTIENNYCLSILNAAQKLEVDVLIARPYANSCEDLYYLEEVDELKQSCLAFDEESFPFNIDAPWGKIFRMDVIRENCISFPENLTRSEDAFFCLQFYEGAKKIGVLNQFGYNHIERKESLCRRYFAGSIETLEKILFENYRWVMDRHPNDKKYLQALWYRVLPGIVECENLYFFHINNVNSKLRKAKEYHEMLKKEMIWQAICELKIANVKNIKYKVRLFIYKKHLGWMFILFKGR